MKKALKGLSGIKVFEILENTETNYRVGDPVSIPYAQKLTRDLQSSSDTIYADDDVYDDEEIVEGEDFELEVPEADLDKFPILEGGIYDESNKEYTWGGNAGKEYGMTFKAKKKDGNYRMFRYYRAKFKKVKQDLQTADNGTTISVLTISGRFYRRAYKGENEVFPAMRTYKDSETSSDLAWLDTIPTIPTPEPIPELGELEVTSVAGTTAGNTAITVSPEKAEGHSYKIKMAANPTLPEYNATISGGYSNWDGEAEIEATAGQKIVVVEVDEENKAKKAGMATLVVAE